MILDVTHMLPRDLTSAFLPGCLGWEDLGVACDRLYDWNSPRPGVVGIHGCQYEIDAHLL